MTEQREDQLTNALTLAQRQGIVGGDLAAHRRHAELFAAVAEGHLASTGTLPRRAVDLGSGGGLPALVLIDHWAATQWLLVEVREKRASFLRRAVRMMGAHDRVTVWDGDAQDAARLDEWAQKTDLVTARAFGRPALVAECGQPFLSPQGAIVVSDPPEDEPNRWPLGRLSEIGLTPQAVVIEDARFTVLHRAGDDQGGVETASSASPRSRRAMESDPLF